MIIPVWEVIPRNEVVQISRARTDPTGWHRDYLECPDVDGIVEGLVFGEELRAVGSQLSAG